MKFDEYITNDNGSFLIARTIKNKYYEFGSYPTLQKAEEECERLDNNGWPIKINKPKYHDFYNSPKINIDEIQDLNQYKSLVLLKISVKLDTNLNKWQIQLVYHDYVYKFGLFVSETEAEEVLQKFLINGNITRETILTILKYNSIEDFKNNTNLEVSYNINSDKYNVQRVNNTNDSVFTLGSYNAENQALNVKKSYLNSLKKIVYFKSQDKKNFIHFDNQNISYYENLDLQNSIIISNGHTLPLNINQLNSLINDFNDSYLSITKLSKKYKISETIIEKIIFNYESGKFNKILDELEKNTQSIETHPKNSQKSEINEISKKEDTDFSDNLFSYYDNLSLKDDGIIIFKSRPLKLKVYEIKELFNFYNNGWSVEDLSKKYNISKYLIRKFIFNCELKKFDEIFKEWRLKNSNKPNAKKLNQKYNDNSTIVSKSIVTPKDLNRNNIDFADEVHTSYDHLRIEEDGSVFAGIMPLLIKVYEIEDIFNFYQDGLSLEDLSKKYNIKISIIKIYIFNYESGNFNEILNEWKLKNSKNHIKELDLSNEESSFYGLPEFEKDLKREGIDFSSEINTYYKDLSLKDDGCILAGNVPLLIKVYEIIDIFNSFKNGVSVNDLSKKYKVTTFFIKKYIFNYESGVFDSILEEWEQKKSSKDIKGNLELDNIEVSVVGSGFSDVKKTVNDEIIDFADENHAFYKDLSLKDDGSILKNNNPLLIKVYEIIDIFNSFKNGVSIKDLSEKYNKFPFLIKKYIFNYESGVFDSILEEWEQKNSPKEFERSSKVIDGNVESENIEVSVVGSGFSDVKKTVNDNIIDFADLDFDFYKDLSLKDDGSILAKNDPLFIKVYEIEDIFNSFKNGVSVNDLSEKYSKLPFLIKRYIFNYESGVFNQILDEWRHKESSKDINGNVESDYSETIANTKIKNISNEKKDLNNIPKHDIYSDNTTKNKHQKIEKKENLLNIKNEEDSTYKSESQSLVTSNLSLKSENLALKSSISKCSNQIEELNQKIDDLNDENLDLKFSITKGSNRIGELKSEVDGLKDEILNLKKYIKPDINDSKVISESENSKINKKY